MISRAHQRTPLHRVVFCTALGAWVSALLACQDRGSQVSSAEAPQDGRNGSLERGGVVTTVRSTQPIWDAKAVLVEEVSIGTDIGDDPYMFGAVASVYATDEEIYVADRQVPAVRVFDFLGRHVRDIGRQGQGPGEFLAPVFVAGTPDGRIVVQDMQRRQRLIVYGRDGSVLEPYRLEAEPKCCTRPPVVLEDGTVWLELRRGGGRTIGMTSVERYVQRFDSDGARGERQAVPLGEELRPHTFRLVDIEHDTYAPFSPQHLWTLSPQGAIVVGVSSDYEFEMRHADGSVTRVIRETPPVEVLDIEAEWHRKAILSSYGWSPEGERVNLEWDEVIPETKPAFERFVVAASGEIWVYREGPSTPVPDCSVGPIGRSGLARVPPACHETTVIVDVFDGEGRYLGELDIPDGFSLVAPYPFVRDDLVVGVVEDESGLQLVKVFRMVVPSGE